MTDRVPHREDLKDYLDYFAGRDLNWSLWHPDVTFIDLNGDDESDLVVEAYNSVAVMVWAGDHYGEPYQIIKGHGPRNPFPNLTFEDWTGDGHPEIIFNYREAYAGTGIGGDTWYKTAIYCRIRSCYPIWHAEVADHFHSVYAKSERIMNSTIDIEISEYSTFLVHTIIEVEGSCDTCYLDFPEIDQSLEIHEITYSHSDVTVQRYLWRDGIFAPFAFNQASNLVENGRNIPENSVLEMNFNNQDVQIEFFMVEDEFPQLPRSIICEVTVDGTRKSDFFPCAPNNTMLRQMDVDGDGSRDLVVHATGQPQTWGFGTENRCAHQRMIVFNRDWTELANITGCVVHTDSFGVTINDIDNDSQMEIVSAGGRLGNFTDCPGIGLFFCWYELNDQSDVYEWDGSTFVYDRSVPRGPDPILMQSE
ncbi:MAG: VCBS repeat-containing protein [Chloroflexota bacterium]